MRLYEWLVWTRLPVGLRVRDWAYRRLMVWRAPPPRTGQVVFNRDLFARWQQGAWKRKEGE